MLVLSRRAGESIQIGDDITITIVKSGANVRIGIDAPKHVTILRSELTDAPTHMADRQPDQLPSLAVLLRDIVGVGACVPSVDVQ